MSKSIRQTIFLAVLMSIPGQTYGASTSVRSAASATESHFVLQCVPTEPNNLLRIEVKLSFAYDEKRYIPRQMSVNDPRREWGGSVDFNKLLDVDRWAPPFFAIGVIAAGDGVRFATLVVKGFNEGIPGNWFYSTFFLGGPHGMRLSDKLKCTNIYPTQE